MISKLVQKVVGSPDATRIEPAELARLVEEGRVVVVDNNTEARWAAGHVPGAVNLDPADYQLADLGTDDLDTTVVFYCGGVGCAASHYAAKRAMRMGFRDVRVMSPGITAWRAAGLPTERGARRGSPRSRT
jgi:rhodanese-related sulfurtransferase